MIKIKEYEVVDNVTDTENYDYEEVTVEELFKKAKLTDKEENEAFQNFFSINIHIMVSDESYGNVSETLYDMMTDSRLKKLHACVFLSLKQKGRGEKFNRLDNDKFKKLVDFAMTHKLPIGFDSCSAFKALNSMKEREDYAKIYEMSEPCESTKFSLYIDVDGYAFPCSFTPGASYLSDEKKDWKDGINMLEANDIIEVWNSDKMAEFRNRSCGTSKNNPLGVGTCVLYRI